MGAATQAVSVDIDALRAAYSAFLATPGRILLSGHSHQAWPDVVRDALSRYFDDSARLADDKWEAAVFPKVDAVGRRILARFGFDPSDPIAFGRSTHELVFRLLSSKPLGRGARIVTTTSEFHSLWRQLTRLEEEGVEVVWVEAQPRAALAERLLAALVPGTTALAVSAVLFEDAFVLPRLGEIVAKAHAVGALPIVDAYHAFNVVPLDWGPAKDHVFATAGGYKYAGFGEGLCWLRVPPDCQLRPVDTGWFADFASLGKPRPAPGGRVTYGPGGARFAGATFDASLFYRAEAVLAHWDRFGLDVSALRALSTSRTRRIIRCIDEAGLGERIVSPREDDRRGGFVTLRSREAGAVVDRLRARGVFADARADLLRLGPAPFSTDAEIDAGVAATVEELRSA